MTYPIGPRDDTPEAFREFLGVNTDKEAAEVCGKYATIIKNEHSRQIWARHMWRIALNMAGLGTR